ncbi:MAG: hypothetical protein HC767_09550 [Akkermansiaceae bacterium]|nr:hypothetical protein [Akkermansiaceae bacterium]
MSSIPPPTGPFKPVMVARTHLPPPLWGRAGVGGFSITQCFKSLNKTPRSKIKPLILNRNPQN